MSALPSPDDAGTAGVRAVSGADVLARRGISPARARPQRAQVHRRGPLPDRIPSVEGPAVMRAVVEQASAEGITVNRVSQGSGAMLLSADELAEMARIGADSGIEVSLFIGPREEWDVGALAEVRRGAVPGRLDPRGAAAPLRRSRRAARAGPRDQGLPRRRRLLELLADMQADGQIPASVVWKVSALLALAKPAHGHPAGTAGRLDRERARRRHPGAARRDAVGHHPAARPVRGGPQRHGRGGPRAGSGRPGDRGVAPVRQVRAAQLAAALPAACIWWTRRPRSPARRFTAPGSPWSGWTAAGSAWCSRSPARRA